MFENFTIKKIGFEAVVVKAIYTPQFNYTAPTLLTEEQYNNLPDNWKINCEVYINGILREEKIAEENPQADSTDGLSDENNNQDNKSESLPLVDDKNNSSTVTDPKIDQSNAGKLQTKSKK